MLAGSEVRALFNGKDLTGWNDVLDNGSEWKVVDGLLEGRGSGQEGAEAISLLNVRISRITGCMPSFATSKKEGVWSNSASPAVARIETVIWSTKVCGQEPTLGRFRSEASPS